VIVVDASAALSALLNDGPARRALAGEQLHVPHLIDSEVANALRRGVASSLSEPGDAWIALDRWRRLGMSRHGVLCLLERVWELRENLSAYDASYVVLAESLDCALVSGDVRLSRASGLRCALTVVPR
jgi:predicted nucleic acid-binding protein